MGEYAKMLEAPPLSPLPEPLLRTTATTQTPITEQQHQKPRKKKRS